MNLRQYLVDDIATVKRRWSVWVSAAAVILLTAVPVADDHWPDLASAVTSAFPTNGRQIAPIAGFVIAVAAQCIRQRAVFDALRGLFRKKSDDAQ